MGLALLNIFRSGTGERYNYNYDTQSYDFMDRTKLVIDNVNMTDVLVIFATKQDISSVEYYYSFDAKLNCEIVVENEANYYNFSNYQLLFTPHGTAVYVTIIDVTALGDTRPIYLGPVDVANPITSDREQETIPVNP